MKIKKKSTKTTLLMGLGALSLVTPIVLSACGSSDINGSYVSIAVADPDNPRWQRAKKDLETSVTQYDDKDPKHAGEKYKFTSIISKNQRDLNNSLVSDLGRSNPPKGIIMGAVDDSAHIIAVDAKKQNIPFVAYDRLVRTTGTSDYSWYATFDNFRVGTLQGLSIASKLMNYQKDNKDAVFNNVKEMVNYYYSGKVDDETKVKDEYKNLEYDDQAKKYVKKTTTTSTTNTSSTSSNDPSKKSSFNSDTYYYSIAGAPTDNNSKLFFDGGTTVLKVLYDITEKKFKALQSSDGDPSNVKFDNVAIADWNYSSAQNKMVSDFSTTYKTNLNNLKAVLSPNDGMADAAIKALADPVVNKKVVNNNIVITGQDSNVLGLNYIDNGQQFMTIFKPDSNLSRVVVAILMQLINSPTLGHDQVFENVKNDLLQKYPDQKDFVTKLTLNRKDYKANGHDITNTVILDPVVVTKDNTAAIRPFATS